MTNKICVYVDVTSLINTAFLSGIQRVVIEITKRLIDSPCVDCILLYYKNKEKVQILDNDQYKLLFDGKEKKEEIRNSTTTNSEIIYKENSIWLDLDAVWNNVPSRAELYPVLKQKGVKIVTLIHDILPITDPRFFPYQGDWAFVSYVGAIINYADTILVTTHTTQNAVKKLIDEVHGRKNIQTAVVGLGADYIVSGSEKEDVAGVCQKYVSEISKYVLMVGTIEPRKNHAVVLRAFEKELFNKGIGLVFAGRKGWNSDSFIEYIERLNKKEKLFAYFEGMNNASIDYLYHNSSIIAFPSYAEGYGLPIVEALQRGVPVIAANIEVSREVGKEYCHYADLEDEDEWIREIDYCIKNNDKLRKRIERYSPTSWDEVVKRIVETLIPISRYV